MRYCLITLINAVLFLPGCLRVGVMGAVWEALLTKSWGSGCSIGCVVYLGVYHASHRVLESSRGAPGKLWWDKCMGGLDTHSYRRYIIAPLWNQLNYSIQRKNTAGNRFINKIICAVPDNFMQPNTKLPFPLSKSDQTF